MTIRRDVSSLGLGLVMALGLAACSPEATLTGERFDVRTDLAASEPTEANPAPLAPVSQPENQSAAISLPQAATLGEWSNRGGSARHDSPHGDLSAAPVLVWAADIGAANARQRRISAAPVVAVGRVFALDAGASLSAVSSAGSLLWQVNLTPDFDDNSDLPGSGLSVDGGLLVASTGYGEVVAIEAASGAIRWRQRLDSLASGAPLAAGGAVYVTSRDGSAWALSQADGRILWTRPGVASGSGMIGSAAPALAGGTVYFPFASGDLLAVAPDGSPVWAGSVSGARAGRAYAGTTDLTGDPVLVGGQLYTGSVAGTTAALDAQSGARIWTAPQGAMGPPLVVGGSVFVVNDEARLVRLDAGSGDLIWQIDMPYFVKGTPKKRKGIHAHYGPVLAGGRIAVVSGDGLLRLFAPQDGSLVGTAAIPGGAASAPALAGGMLYVVSTRGQLLAFR